MSGSSGFGLGFDQTVVGVLIRIVDHSAYKSVWFGMWWVLQTVTTVGYGDVTPADTRGRIIAAVLMLTAIGFLAGAKSTMSGRTACTR